jgi:hypothetical protein
MGRHTRAGHRTATRQRTTEVTDAHTHLAHRLTASAMEAGRSVTGSYIALCGETILPASLTTAYRGRCHLCAYKVSG